MAQGTVTGKTTQAKTNWRVTLIGTNEVESPLVNVGVTFAANAPKVKIAHARFDGTDLEETNGIQVQFAPRAAGDVRLVASWGGHPFTYEVDTFNDTTGAPGPAYPNQGPSTNVDLSSPVTANDTWRLVLKNTEAGFRGDGSDRHRFVALSADRRSPFAAVTFRGRPPWTLRA